MNRQFPYLVRECKIPFYRIVATPSRKMIKQRKSSEQPEQKLNNNRGVGGSGGNGSVGGNVLNAQGNIELTKKNNLSKKERAERRKTVMIRFGCNENKENQQVVRFADGGTTMESTPPPKDFKRTTDRDLSSFR